MSTKSHAPAARGVPAGIGAKRLVAGSKHGLKDWLLQRMTAVVMVLFTLVALATVLFAADPLAAWQALFENRWARVLALLTWLSLTYHAWVGMRDIWMDYIKPLGLRIALNVATALWLMASALYCAMLLWR